MTINVSPLAVTPYNSIWDGITGDMVYYPLHLIADVVTGTTDLLSAYSTLDSAPALTHTSGTVLATGGNEGWFTAQGDNRAALIDNAIMEEFLRTDNMQTGNMLIISVWIYLPAAGTTTSNALLALGQTSSGNSGFWLDITGGEKARLETYFDTTNVTSGVTINTVVPETPTHILGYIEKTATGFQVHIALDGVIENSSADTAVTGWAPADINTPRGFSLFTLINGANNNSAPIEADVQISDVIIARTTGDKTAHMAELVSRQSRVRTALVDKWKDVL